MDNTELWENGELGRDEEYAEVSEYKINKLTRDLYNLVKEYSQKKNISFNEAFSELYELRFDQKEE